MAMKNNPSNENTLPINFHPMPKRFMVWDKVGRRFLCRRTPNSIEYVYPIFELPLEIDCLDDDEKTQYVICQSTNLFDKDGKEIFEGSIVMYNRNTYFVRQDRYNGMWLLKNVKTGDCSESIDGWENGKDERLKLLGHILSNPELVEDGNG